ncbi:MAG: 50S ribosomal protein L10, partial [Nitriliruptorales bacterium]|nr:50S ribosomal protein L10 [Nitriliruptorales bacterium]
MARPEKVAAVEDVKERFDASAALLLTEYRGLSVGDLAELRAALRAANATYRVAKNTLVRRAFADVGIEGLDDMLNGPTALVFCGEDPVGPAKALKAFAKDHEALVVKGGWLDGEVLTDEEAIKLADLASREELLARLAGLMYGALANTARLMKAPLEQQARLVQALIDAGGNADVDEPAAATTVEDSEAADDVAEPAADDSTTEAPAAEDDAAAGAPVADEPA